MPVQAPAPKGHLITGDVFTSPKINKGRSKCLVVEASYGGGSDGHDAYPDGWFVQYIVLSPDALSSPIAIAQVLRKKTQSFPQSGSFNGIIEPKDTRLIGRMKETRTWTWTKFPDKEK